MPVKSKVRPKAKKTEAERTHGHCADVLMKDYGIPKELRASVCEEIAKVWVQNTMVHCLIITSVRGWQPSNATRGLQYFLMGNQTHSPLNHKPGY